MKYLALLLVCACATVQPAGERPGEQDAVIARFREAVAAGRFDDVLPLLSKRWRDRYDATRLAEDFDAEPLASWRTQQPLKLVQEEDGWKIDALE